ncbi:CHASE4 domain-containing protein [uncultured Methanoregula sp.]|uniref:CHASE4 domain-containing protein n=1 Tax=uncultured Methanoregula sp. TaxID=1005933 RepID=UPI00374A3DBA
MHIRNKTLIALGITFAVLFGIIAGISLFLYIEELGSLEYHQTQKEVTRVKNVIANEQEDLSSTLHDWAYWDETYAFTANRDPGYVSRNLNEGSLSVLRLNLFMVTDTSGNILYGTMVDPATGRQAPLFADVLQALPPGHPFMNHTRQNSTKTGLLLLSGDPMIVVSAPVLTSSKEGPVHGVLVMGRYIDQKTLDRMNRVTETAITVHWPDDPSADEQERQLLMSNVTDFGTASIPRNADLLSGYTVVQDINGKNILLGVDLPRDLYRYGLSAIVIYLVLFTCIILVAAFLVMYIMDRVVLRRVEFLTRKVERLGQGNQTVPDPELTGDDEIVTLEREILSSHNRLIVSEHTLRTFINAVTDPAFMLTPDGTIILANTALAQVYHKPVDDLIGTPFRNYLSEEELWQHKEKFAEALHEKKIVQYETTVGEKQYFVSVYPVIDNKGSIGQIAILTTDITDRKRTEDALSLAKRKISLLNSVIFNDIQNQIFVQLAFISLARPCMTDQKGLAYIGKEEAAAKLIQSHLSFLQKYQTLGTNPPRWYDVSDVMLFSLSHLDQKTVRHDLAVQGVEIFSDPLLENVFFHLFENSLLHGGNVSVIRAMFREVESGLILIIEDDGTGIPDGEKEYIFEKGSGVRGEVGLFLVREILSITGITIKETGVYGIGARFEIHVPPGIYRIRKD